MVHVVDIAPLDNSNVAESIQKIMIELRQFSPELAEKERWLVFNKIDLLPINEVDERCQAVINGLGWRGPIFKISAVKKQGTKELCYKLMEFLEERKR